MKRLATLLAAFFLSATPALSDPLVFAAASTQAVIDAALAESGIGGATSYAASGVLARQIEQGAPADVFVSANPEWMQHLVDLGLVAGDDVVTFASNSLVLIAPAGSSPLALEASSLAAALADAPLAMADVIVAPVGRYGQEALASLDLWPVVEPRYVPTRNTIATVAAVVSGEAALGLVYRTDAMGVDGLSIVAELPGTAHAPISYLVAPLEQGGDAEGGRALAAFLLSAEGQAILGRLGFVPTVTTGAIQ